MASEDSLLLDDDDNKGVVGAGRSGAYVADLVSPVAEWQCTTMGMGGGGR